MNTETAVLFSIEILLVALVFATHIAGAIYQTEWYLWFRIDNQLFLTITQPIYSAVMLAPVHWILRNEEYGFLLWFALYVTFAFIIRDLDHRLNKWAGERMITRALRNYPHYCPICVFIWFGVKRGFCKPGHVLEGHKEVHDEIEKCNQAERGRAA